MGEMTEAETRYGQNEKELSPLLEHVNAFPETSSPIGTVELLVKAFFCNTALLHCLGVAN